MTSSSELAVPNGTDDRGTYVRMIDGRRWYPYDCRAEDVRAIDTRALLNVNRFGGRTRYPMPVLCHSLRVCEIVAAQGHGRDVQWAALIHDAHECVPPGDVETPMKRPSPSSRGAYGVAASDLEYVAMRAYRRALMATHDLDAWDAVADADAQAFREEWEYLRGEQDVPMYYAADKGAAVDYDEAWLDWRATWNRLAPEGVERLDAGAWR